MKAPVRSGRLLLRLYGAGLLQAVLSATVVFVVIMNSEAPMQPLLDRHARYVANELLRHWDDEGDLFAHAADAARVLGAEVTVLDGAGGARFTSGNVVTHWYRKPLVASVPVVRDGRTLGAVRVATTFEPPWSIPTLFWSAVLVSAGLAALLVARSLVKTIQGLARAAHAVGQGDLRARVDVRSRDELGQLGDAFNAMAERLEHTIAVQAELLANVSHELRTPLARMRVALDLAEEGEPLKGDDLHHVSEDLAELEALVSDIITAARLDVQQGRANGVLANLQTREIALREIVGASAQRFASRHPGRALDVALPPEGATVRASSALLRRAVDNLLENAARYSEADRPIALRAGAGEGGARIEVEDRGVGMTEEDVARAFEPFFRSDRSRSRASGGLGLGLTLARRIVEAHGGTVELRSVPGAGTTARVELPLVDAATQA